MTEGASNKVDPAAPPSYAVATAQHASTSSHPPVNVATVGHSTSQTTPLVMHPIVDPRSQTHREAARNRAILRFFEAFLWAVVIYALTVAILGGGLWPQWRHGHH